MSSLETGTLIKFLSIYALFIKVSSRILNQPFAIETIELHRNKINNVAKCLSSMTQFQLEYLPSLIIGVHLLDLDDFPG